MKQKLLKLLSIFVAFLTAIPIANAANITYSVNTTPLWARPGAISAANARSMAVSNGKVYVVSSNSSSKIVYIGENDAFIDAEGNWPGFESGFTASNIGFGMDNDDAGNIVVKSGNAYYSAPTQLTVYEVGTLKSKIIDIPAEFQPGDRTDNIRAQGNLLAGKGYMWFIPKGSEKIIRLNLENGAIVNKTEWTHTLGVASTTSFAYMLDNGKIYMHHRKGSPNNAYLLTVPANGGAVTSSETILSGDPGDQLTSEVFTIQGVNFVAYNLGTNAQDARFSIKNLSTGSDLNASPICPFGITASSQTGLDSYSTYFKSVKVDANTVDLYCFTPNHGASVYRVTANVSVNTVTNVNTAYVDASTKKEVKLSWDAPATDVPSKYVIKYSSDGGTTWSSAIETTALSYTFTGLPTGTYTFKVSPYYEQYLTYGAEVKSAEIYMQEKLPTGYVFTVSKKWEASGTLNNFEDETTPAGKSIAVSNGMLYVSAMNQYGTISYVNNNNSTWPNFNSGYNKGAFGYGMDNDDAGNIIVAANSVGTSTPKNFAVYPAGATSNANKKEFTLGDAHLPGGRADYIGATGDIFDGTGYLWFAPQKTKTTTGNRIVRIKIENKSGVPTSTEITTWTHSFSDNSSEVIVRPLEDGRLYFHNHQNECKIFTLPAGGGAISSANVENINLGTTQTSNFSSDAIILKGNVLNIRNAGVADQDISFEIYNATTGGFATYNNEQVITPFGGKRTTGEINPLSGIAKIGSIVRAVKVNDETVDVYVYSPFHGASCYRIGTTPIYVVTGPLTSLVYEYLEVPTDEGTRRDIKLTWGAPEGDTPTSYRIYRGGTLIATVDGSELTYTNEKVNANYTYTVIPYYDGVPEDESLGKSVTTTEVETVMYAPIITEMRTYNGYSIAQFFFKMPSLSTIKPVSFNIYRNDQLIESGITQYNYIDDDLPKIDVDKEYTYYVEAVYSDEYNNVTRKSLGEPVMITYRDWALAGYMIEEIYNVPINQAIGNLPNNFTNYDYYRQGQFYNGHWYIAQRADDLCQKDQDKANGITNSVRDDMKSDNADATGGVVVIKATEEPDVRMGFTGKILTNDAFENVGIAMDDKGTIFMRNNNVTKLAATTPSDGNATEVAKLHDGFGRRITEGHLYTRNADGSYSATPTTLDLQAL